MIVTMVNALKLLIAVFASYFPIVAISGYLAAWIAKKFGDNTAEQEGLLTLNPIEHTSFFGLIILLMATVTRLPFILALGRQIPLDENKICLPFRKIKYLIALWGKPLANLLISFLVIFIWVVFWKVIGIPYQIDQHYPILASNMQLLYKVFMWVNIASLMLEWVFGFVIFIMSFILPKINEESYFVILVIQIYLLILTWCFVEPYIYNSIMMIEFLFRYIINGLVS